MSGEYGELIDTLRRRLEDNPLDAELVSILAVIQQVSGHLTESAATYRRLLELNPAQAGAQAQYGLTLLLMGNNAQALTEANKEAYVASKLQILSCIYWAMSRRAESDTALGALEQRFKISNAYEIASVHAYRGEADAAFSWLERAYTQIPGSLAQLKVDPLFLKLHGDPRFDALLHKLKLVD